jgi:hypothetical protein
MFRSGFIILRQINVTVGVINAGCHSTVGVTEQITITIIGTVKKYGLQPAFLK